MFNSRITHSLLLAGLLVFSSSTYAAVYNFGSLLTASSGYTAPDSFSSTPFAQLETTDNGGGSWEFMLAINNNFLSSFGEGAFIGSMSYDFTPDPSVSIPPHTFISSNTGGVTSVEGSNGTGLSGLPDIDF